MSADRGEGKGVLTEPFAWGFPVTLGAGPNSAITIWRTCNAGRPVCRDVSCTRFFKVVYSLFSCADWAIDKLIFFPKATSSASASAASSEEGTLIGPVDWDASRSAGASAFEDYSSDVGICAVFDSSDVSICAVIDSSGYNERCGKKWKAKLILHIASIRMNQFFFGGGN